MRRQSAVEFESVGMMKCRFDELVDDKGVRVVDPLGVGFNQS